MITVVAATHNGSQTLDRFLQSLELQDTQEEWQLLIVDNASDDNSGEIIANYSQKLPINRLYEAKKGKNAALNRALNYIKGDIVVFTDDDIIASPSWLTAYRKAFTKYPDFSVFGGVIQPYWESLPSSLHLQTIPQGPVYALTRDEWPEGECNPYNIWGPNMAIRSEIFEKGFRFDEKVGPNSESRLYLMGSETSFTSMLLEAGYKSCHVKEPAVQHIIRSHQMDPDWIFTRGIRYGRSLFDPPPNQEYRPRRIYGYPLYMIFHFINCFADVLLTKFYKDKSRHHAALWNLNVAKGKLIEAKRRYDL